MTEDAKLKSKFGRGTTRFKFNQSPRTMMILLGVFAAALLVAAPASTQVSERSNSPKIEVFGGRQAIANEVLVKFRDSATPEGRAQAAQDGDVDSDEEVGGTGV